MISLPAQTTMPSISLSFESFKDEIAWILHIDPECEIYAENSAIYCDFHGTLDEVQMAIDDRTCLDLRTEPKWIAWDDIEELPAPDEIQRFRFIVTA